MMVLVGYRKRPTKTQQRLPGTYDLTIDIGRGWLLFFHLQSTTLIATGVSCWYLFENARLTSVFNNDSRIWSTGYEAQQYNTIVLQQYSSTTEVRVQRGLNTSTKV